MHIRFVRLFVLVLVFASIALAQGDADGAIRDLVNRWQELYNQRDYQAVADLYVEDALFFGIDGGVHEGRDAIRDALAVPLPMPPGEGTMEITADEVEVIGDTAYVVGQFVVSAPDGSTMVEGHYIAIDKLVDGTWMLHRHISNLAMPDPETAAP
jgi:uncharacterized protein (TIGR02246 family)